VKKGFPKVLGPKSSSLTKEGRGKEREKHHASEGNSKFRGVASFLRPTRVAFPRVRREGDPKKGRGGGGAAGNCGVLTTIGEGSLISLGSAPTSSWSSFHHGRNEDGSTTE